MGDMTGGALPALFRRMRSPSGREGSPVMTVKTEFILSRNQQGGLIGGMPEMTIKTAALTDGLMRALHCRAMLISQFFRILILGHALVRCGSLHGPGLWPRFFQA